MAQAQLLNAWLLGDEDAVLFAEKLFMAAQVWDDVEDCNNTEHHNELGEWLLYGKGENPFYSKHRDQLDPVLYCMYSQWRDANVLERQDKIGCQKAYMLRAGIYTVWVFMARLIGGESHARKVGPEIYNSYGESLNDLLKEFGHCQIQ